MNLFHFLEDLLHRTDSQVKDFREKTIKDMSKSDLARYAKAYAEVDKVSCACLFHRNDIGKKDMQ